MNLGKSLNKAMFLNDTILYYYAKLKLRWIQSKKGGV